MRFLCLIGFATIILMYSFSTSMAENDPSLKSLVRTSCNSVATMNCRWQVASSQKQSRVWDIATCMPDSRGQLAKSLVKSCQRQLATGLGTLNQRINAKIALIYSTPFENASDRDKLQIKAISDLKIQYPENPDVLFAYFRLLQLHFVEMSIDPKSVIEKLIEVAPEDWRGHYLMAYRFRYEKRLSITLTDKLIELAPENPLALARRAEALEINERAEEALLTYEKASKLATRENFVLPGIVQESDLHPVWAKLAAKMQGPERGIAIMNDFLSRNDAPQIHFYFLQRASYFVAQKEYAKAIEDLRRAANVGGERVADELYLDQLLLRVKAGEKIPLSAFSSTLNKNPLKRILKLQVMLRNSGLNDVEINGKFDQATEKGLVDCSAAPDCGATKWLKL
jgi:tetratricopeptide (TPR) repeat protein